MLHRLRETIKPLVPRRLQADANRAVFAGVGVALRGNEVECPCCGHTYRRFVSYPTLYCPGCGSYERQRALCLYLDDRPELVSGDVLQVGPERSIVDRFRARAGTWLAVDVDPGHPLADRTMSVLQLELPDGAFSLVLCSHVLDIVEPHDEAVAELHRVTQPGGCLIVQAPWRSVRGDPDAYARRLALPGFRVTPVLVDEQRDERARLRYGLHGDEPLFVCLRA